MNDLKNWFDPNQENWLELKRALDQPIVQRALGLLVELGLPRTSPTPPGVDFLAWNANLNASREGYTQFYLNLKQMTVPPKAEAPSQVQEPWGTLISDKQNG